MKTTSKIMAIGMASGLIQMPQSQRPTCPYYAAMRTVGQPTLIFDFDRNGETKSKVSVAFAVDEGPEDLPCYEGAIHINDSDVSTWYGCEFEVNEWVSGFNHQTDTPDYKSQRVYIDRNWLYDQTKEMQTMFADWYFGYTQTVTPDDKS